MALRQPGQAEPVGVPDDQDDQAVVEGDGDADVDRPAVDDPLPRLVPDGVQARVIAEGQRRRLDREGEVGQLDALAPGKVLARDD